jgi:hypothetical protein
MDRVITTNLINTEAAMETLIEYIDKKMNKQFFFLFILAINSKLRTDLINLLF